MNTQTISGVAKNARVYVALIVVVVAVASPINYWMFDRGIGLTGVEPPNLPYHLSGVLIYLTKYIIPFVIAYFYAKTRRRSLLLAGFLAGYALLLGVSSISRSAILFVMGPVVALAWVDKRFLLLAITSFITLISVSLVTLSRGIVYVVVGNQAAAITTEGVIGTLSQLFTSVNIDIAPIATFTGLLGRLEGFQNLVLASQFDPSAIGGTFAVVLKIIWNPLADWDHDAYHIEWQGFTIPEGLFSGGSLLSWMLMASNLHFLTIGLVAILAAAFMLALESSTYAVAQKYAFPPLMAQAVVAFFAILFFTGPGADIFVMPVLALILLRIMPTFYRFRLY